MVSQPIPKPQRQDPPVRLSSPPPPPPAPPAPPSQMSTAPAKSQPLHNFSLTHLKWGKNQTTNHHRLRKPTDSPSPADHLPHHPSEPESDGSNSRSGDHRNPPHKPPAAGSAKTADRADEVVKSNLVVRFPKGSNAANVGSNANGNGGGGGEEGEAEEAVGKPWNLRPRRYLYKSNTNENTAAGGGSSAAKNGEVEEKHESHSKANRVRGSSEAENGEKKDKTTLWVSLTRDEIEEDYFVLTGSKLPRRPKKRNRTVQKQLDNCFPGLWLSGISLDLYNVPEPSKK